MLVKLKEQLLEQEDLIVASRRDYDNLSQEMIKIQAENECAKDEAKDVLQALEELAMNYDQKIQECEAKNSEYIILSEELSQKQSQLNAIQSELKAMRDSVVQEKCKVNDLVRSLLNDLGEIGTVISNNSNELKKAETQSTNLKIEEEFIVARLYVSKMKSEVKNVVNKLTLLEQSQNESSDKIENLEKELSETRLLVGQHKAKLESLNEALLEVDAKKRTFEEQVDDLQEEITQMRAAQQMTKVSSNQRPSDTNMKSVFEEQISQQREQHQKQVFTLRNEITEKQLQIDELRDAIQKLSLAQNQLQIEYDYLKEEEHNKSKRLQELISINEKREQAKQDLKGLEDTVMKELQTLHTLRNLFLQDLQARIKKSAAGEEIEEQGGSQAQKQKIAFLENNLEQLTKVHKQLVRDNADLRCELPKLEKRRWATMERVKALEIALRESKESAMRDRKRYQVSILLYTVMYVCNHWLMLSAPLCDHISKVKSFMTS